MIVGGNKQQNFDIGLVNVATNESTENKIPIWEIVEVVSVVILLLLVIRWIRKWQQKKKVR